MLENVEKELSAFAKYVVKQSKANLSRQGRTNTKDLHSSIDYDLKVSANSFSLSFYMMEYGAYVDQGVRGKMSSAKAPNSPFRFGTGSGKKGGLSKSISNWIRQRGIKGRDKKGRFITNKSLTFLISRSIYQKGIKPSLFFTKPFEKAFDNLADDVIEQFGLDLDDLLEQTLNA